MAVTEAQVLVELGRAPLGERRVGREGRPRAQRLRQLLQQRLARGRVPVLDGPESTRPEITRVDCLAQGPMPVRGARHHELQECRERLRARLLRLGE